MKSTYPQIVAKFGLSISVYTLYYTVGLRALAPRRHRVFARTTINRLRREVSWPKRNWKSTSTTPSRAPSKLPPPCWAPPEKTLRHEPSPDGILEILGHPADMEIRYAYRIRQMVADKDPVIASIDQDAWAKNLGYLESSPPELVALYGLNRHANVGLLRRLKAEDLQKAAPSRIGPSGHRCRLPADDVETRAEPFGADRAA
jgi:hypothetical protein